MVDRSPAIAGDPRVGIALSRRLLAALRSSVLHNEIAPAPLHAAADPRKTDISRQLPTSSSADLAARTDTQQEAPLARLPLPEIGKFRVYSPFGHNVQAIASRGNVEVGNFLMATEDEDHRDVSASEAVGLPGLLDDPIRRRSWLLAKALQTHPLDQALDLARVAEAFITGSSATETASAAPASDPGQPARSIAETDENRGLRAKTQRVRLGLAPEERDRLLKRLLQGARNAELASEFNLSPKQVQGIRIGSAREISRRRNTTSNHG